jgi:hypothetical protein
MNAHFLRTLGLALAGCLWAASTRAGDDMPVKIDFVFRFDVKCGPSVFVPPDLAPWYMWFPNQPLPPLQAAQTSPYPNWPSTWPPSNQGHAAPRNYSMTSQAPFGGNLTSPGFQQAGPVAMQAPSYWYGR